MTCLILAHAPPAKEKVCSYDTVKSKQNNSEILIFTHFIFLKMLCQRFVYQERRVGDGKLPTQSMENSMYAEIRER